MSLGQESADRLDAQFGDVLGLFETVLTIWAEVKTQQKVVTKEQFIGSYGEPSNALSVSVTRAMRGMTKFLDLINAHTEDPKQVFAMIDRSSALTYW